MRLLLYNYFLFSSNKIETHLHDPKAFTPRWKPLSLHRVATRAFTTTARQMKNKVPEQQKIFQADNDLPVHIKGGTSDVLLYRLTMTLTIVGTGFSCYWLLAASMPKRKAE